MFHLEKVVFIPANNPPLKKEALAPSRHRFEMVRLAIDSHPGFEISDCECGCEDASYTIHTIRKMTEQYASRTLYFIMGLDAFLDMPKWFKAEEILASIPIIVMARPPIPMDEILESPYVHDVEVDGKAGQVRLKNGKYLSVAHITPNDISSTNIRQAVREGRTIKYLLPECVQSYIITNELYK